MGIKYRVNEKFFDTWSDEMAYVLGFLFADGSLEESSAIRGKYLRVTNTNKGRIDAIRSLLGAKHPIQVHWHDDGTRRTCYLLRIGSHVLFNALLLHGVTPRKSLTMQFPQVPEAFLAAFVRGYFDGDGCVHLEKKANDVKRMRVIFTSGSKMFLLSLLKRLRSSIGGMQTDIRISIRPNRAPIYQLRISTRDSLRLFSLIYPRVLPRHLFLRRKYAIFIKYLKLRGIQRIDIPRILRKQGPVVKG